MKKYVYSALVLAFFTVSCSEGSAESAKADNNEKQKVENCIYSYNPAKTQLDWTAYKFIRKAGVNGTFTNIEVDGDKSGSDVQSIIESLSFSIPISSIDTKDDSRNKKIQEFFFGNLASPELIAGKVVALKKDSVAVLEITMNEIARNVEGTYSLVDNVFNYSTEINVLDWNAKQGLDELNRECEGLHTDVENGDTESKLWPDVSISFKTTLDKKCN